MAKLTREEVVQRAMSVISECSYEYGANDLRNYPSGKRSDGFWHTDCSAYAGWCWGSSARMTSATFIASSNFRRVRQAGSTIEECYPGITAGDALVRSAGYAGHSSGHVAIYIGNNTIVHCSGSKSLPHGCGYAKGATALMGDYIGYVSYDPSTSFDYDPDIEDPITKPQVPPVDNGQEPSPPFMNGQYDDAKNMYLLQRRYIRNYKLCKFMRHGR